MLRPLLTLTFFSLTLSGFAGSCGGSKKNANGALSPAGTISFEKKESEDPPPPVVSSIGTEETQQIGYDEPEDRVIRLRLDPVVQTIPVGVTQQFRAVAVYESGVEAVVTQKVTWASSAPTVAAFLSKNDPGLLTTLAIGQFDIRIEFDEVKFSQTVAVEDIKLERVEITPKVILIGSKQKLYASAIYTDKSVRDITSQVTWRSADETVGKFLVDNDGFTKIFGEGPGRVTVFADFDGQGVAASIEVRLKKLLSMRFETPSSVVVKGSSINMTAIGSFEDDSVAEITNFVTWSTSDDAVVTVGNSEGNYGLITGVNAGVATISATLDGVVITQDIESILARFTSISILPNDTKVPVGLFKNYKAYGVLPNGQTQEITNNAVWTTSDDKVAPVTNNKTSSGKVSGEKKGNANITVTYGDLVVVLPVEVTNAAVVGLTIGNHPASVICGIDAPVLTVSAAMSDNTVQDMSGFVTWTSPDITKATVSNAQVDKGTLATLDVSTGMKLYAEYHENLTGETIIANTDIIITEPQMVSVEVVPSSSSIAIGSPVQFVLLGHYSCGAPVDYTESATWTSANVGVLTVSDSLGSKGFGMSAGSTMTDIVVKVTAVKDSFSDDIDFVIRPEEVKAIQIVASDTQMNVDVNGSKQFYAKSVYTNGTIVDVTTTATWYVDANKVDKLTVDDDAQKGVATGLSEDYVSLKATLTMPYGTFTGEGAVSVQSPCPPGGTRTGLFCWYLGGLGQSCTDTCLGVGATTHTWATSWAGSGGGPQAGQCQQVLRDLNFTGNLDTITGSSFGGNGIGCSIYAEYGLNLKTRYDSPATDNDSFELGYKRACACKHY